MPYGVPVVQIGLRNGPGPQKKIISLYHAPALVVVRCPSWRTDCRGVLKII